MRGRAAQRLARCAVGAAALAFQLVVAGAAPAGLVDAFVDPTDGRFDVGDYLLNRRGVLFNPLVITEPAVGYGGGGTLLYFHKTKEDAERAHRGEPLGLPPSVSFAVGLATENGTWAAGGGHFASWRRDGIRYLGAAGYTSLNLDFYLGNASLAYDLKGGFLVQELRLRMHETPVFLGARYVYARLDAGFDALALVPADLPGRDADDLGGLGLSVLWDTRDKLLDPTEGQQIEALGMFFGPWMGGDDWFPIIDLRARSFHRVHERFRVNLRADATLSFMDPPFYALPSVSLRGVSARRYQGRYAGAFEVEGRWLVLPRWTLLGFAGMGWRIDGLALSGKDDSVVPAGGGGFRYLIARQLGLNMGMDFAASPDQFAFYIQVGGSWN